MKKLFNIALCALAMLIAMPQQAEAAKKKEKKAFEWEMPELSGNADVDNYLLKCDTLWTKIKSYSTDITFYEMAEITVTNADGTTEKTYQMVDKDGVVRSKNLAFKQNMDIILAYPDIVLKLTDLATAQLAAVTAAPSLGLGALKYGKYIKAGPKIIEMGGQEMKTIYKRARAQAAQIKALKEGKIDDAIEKNTEVQAGQVEAGATSIRQITKTKEDYDKELAAATQVDNANSVDGMNIPEEEG
jgi:hypothetical protein